MNLNQFTPLQQFWHNTTFIDGTSSNTRIKDAGANQSWSLQNFFGIAMPLMVGTVLVPLVIGSIIRAFLQGLAQGRTWWRLLLAIIVIGLDITSSMIKECGSANVFSIAIPSRCSGFRWGSYLSGLSQHCNCSRSSEATE
jgi:hypothetical protein